MKDGTVGDLSQSETFGYCAKAADGTVAYQNTLCTRVCGYKVETVCTACPSAFSQKSRATGSKMVMHKNVRVSGVPCDMVMLNSTTDQITLFYPLNDYFNALFKSLSTLSFTKQEERVVHYLLSNTSNKEIAAHLKISMPTLKTHLNHIYQKCKDLKTIRKELR